MLTINAKVSPIQDVYTIIFKVDDEVFATLQLEYGDIISLSQIPTKSDDLHSYIFTGWAGLTEGMVVTSDQVFYATFETTQKTYTITFMLGEQYLESQTLNAGETIVYPTVQPFYTENGKKFNFVAWSSTSETALKTEVIYAIYAEEGKMCTVQYYNNGILFYETEVPSGTKLQYINDIPTKDKIGNTEFTFSNWNGQEEGSYILDDIKLTAEFEEVTTNTKQNSSFAIDRNFIIIALCAAIVVVLIIIIVTKKRD